MSIIDHEIRFAVLNVTCFGEKVTVEGRNCGGTIFPGQRFTVLSESIVTVTPEGYGPASLKPVGAVDLRIESIWFFGRFFCELSPAYKARLELVGTGGELIKPHLMLSIPKLDVSGSSDAETGTRSE